MRISATLLFLNVAFALCDGVRSGGPERIRVVEHATALRAGSVVAGVFVEAPCTAKAPTTSSPLSLAKRMEAPFVDEAVDEVDGYGPTTFTKPQPTVMDTKPARVQWQHAPMSKSLGGDTMARKKRTKTPTTHGARIVPTTARAAPLAGWAGCPLPARAQSLAVVLVVVAVLLVAVTDVVGAVGAIGGAGGPADGGPQRRMAEGGRRPRRGGRRRRNEPGWCWRMP